MNCAKLCRILVATHVALSGNGVKQLGADLAEVLADPLVHLVMRRDGVRSRSCNASSRALGQRCGRSLSLRA